jgi:hypothetical protein
MWQVISTNICIVRYRWDGKFFQIGSTCMILPSLFFRNLSLLSQILILSLFQSFTGYSHLFILLRIDIVIKWTYFLVLVHSTEKWSFSLFSLSPSVEKSYTDRLITRNLHLILNISSFIKKIRQSEDLPQIIEKNINFCFLKREWIEKYWLKSQEIKILTDKN